jgi:hypothetical protein
LYSSLEELRREAVEIPFKAWNLPVPPPKKKLPQDDPEELFEVLKSGI